MLTKFFAPSRWGEGVSLLWRGNTFASYLEALSLNHIDSAEPSALLSIYHFDSARNALYHHLKSLGIGKGDLVQVMNYTCDAVTNVLVDLGCRVQIYDCDSNFKAVNFKLHDECKVLITQITFGQSAHPLEYLELVAKKDVCILIDKSLSYGIEDFSPQTKILYPTIISFEVSKSITFGWGGSLLIPRSIKFNMYYSSLEKVSIVRDFYRNIVTMLNLFFIKRSGKISFIFWIFSKILLLQRPSYRSSSPYCRSHSRPGVLTDKVIRNSLHKIPKQLKLANNNHRQLARSLEAAGIKVNSSVDENNSSPRVHFYLTKNLKQKFIKFMRARKIEVGEWFHEPPVIHGSKDYLNSKTLFEESVNLSCHWTLTDHEILHMQESIFIFFNQHLNE